MAPEQTYWQWLKQKILYGILGLIIFAALLYLGDWAVWRARVAFSQDHRGGISTVTVNRFVVAPLKGSREEYYYDGKESVDCSQSIFPQTAAGPCWYVRRHPNVFERVN
jgi:hypothetical protein